MNSENLARLDNNEGGEAIYSKVVRAGKRTYYFDVKSTRGNDYFIIITESRKRFDQQGNMSVTRQQMHLYKEDFEKFTGGLNELIDFIKERKPEYFEQQAQQSIDEEFENL